VRRCGYTYYPAAPWKFTISADPAGTCVPLDGLVLVLHPLGKGVFSGNYYTWRSDETPLSSHDDSGPQRFITMQLSLPGPPEPTCDPHFLIDIYHYASPGVKSFCSFSNNHDAESIVSLDPLKLRRITGGTDATTSEHFDCFPSFLLVEDIKTGPTGAGETVFDGEQP